jgi:hypothetical protein
MKECLNEEALIELLLGEGSPQAQLHVRSCAGCTRSFKNLAQNMKLIEAALSAPPPPLPVSLRLLPWMRAVAPALAAAAALFIAGFWLGQRFLPHGSEIVSASAVGSAPQEASPLALAARNQAGLASEPASASYVTFLRDNFEQDDTCLGQDRQFNPACSRSWTGETR